MKKIFSFLELIIFSIIAIFGNTMMFFPVHAGEDMNMGMSTKDCIENNHSSSNTDPCNHSCCYKSSNDIYFLADNTNTQNSNNVLKIKIKATDLFAFSLISFENKNLVKIVSPPYFFREIKYYSYKDLIKITKSNT